MSVQLKEIASLFCPETQWNISKIEENFKEIHLEFELSDCDYNTETLADEPDMVIPQRDTISFVLMEEGERIASYYPTAGQNWNDFVSSAKANSTEEKCQLLVDVKKCVEENRCTVYYQEELLNYVERLTVEETLGQFDTLITGRAHVVFEVQDPQFAAFKAQRFAFVQKDAAVDMPTELPDLDVVEKSKKICTNNLQAEHLLPDFFEVEGGADIEKPWQRVMSNCGQLLVLCYLADFARLGDGCIEYKINGYKTVHKTIDAGKITTENIVSKSLPIYCKIYKWLYQGGNIYDKITIIRNIVTLNVEDDCICLKETTFDSILSNYNIFEKKNVEQYIGLRNNVAVQLRAYQKEILDAVESYENGMRTMFFGYMTFVFTTVIIRVMAKNVEEAVLIPDTIIILLMLYCAASLLYQCFTRKILDGRIKLLDKQYNDTRNFYAELLSEKELNELFTDQRNKDGTYRAFLEEREVHFDILWMVLNILTVIALICILFFINH